MDSQPPPAAPGRATAEEEPAHAEIEEVWPRDGRIRVVGFVADQPGEAHPPVRDDSRVSHDSEVPDDGEAPHDSEAPDDNQVRDHSEAPDGTEAVLVARSRGAHGTEVRAGAHLRNGRFDAGLPVDALAAGCDGRKLTWDLYLVAAPGADELRLGRHLDDIRGKKKIFTYPAQTAGSVRVKPYFTVKDNLSVTCRREAV
ncbi:hypothetical protein ABT112_01870 [Streptomyces sp. NPDC002055]|uniref:hypothetical protein n=1 Tax=Streptomyces sp. NPDC002055 TaxID=3154534 RepID=UPI00331CB366